jgi:hypothetical protein
MPDNPLLVAAVKYRYRLDRMSQYDLDRLIAAYKGLAGRLKDKIDLLVLELEKLGPITGGQLARAQRYKQLMDAIASELEKYSVYMDTELKTIAQAALSQATLDASALTRLSATQAGVTASLNKLPNDTIKTLLGFLSDESPLYKRLYQLAPTTVDRISSKLIEGVGLGYNPQKVGNMIVDLLGEGLSSAMRWARTTQMWTYREAGRATMVANADILDGWVWFAILDDAVPPCESCLAKHGELFPLDETLDDHYNGRCVAIPHVAGDDNPVQQTGEDWFSSLDPEKQKEILGAGKLEAYNDGKFEFGQLSRQVPDDVFGSMRVGVPLKDLIGE